MTPSNARAATVSILVGAALLIWPAALNVFPILFSDTGALLESGFVRIGWDKPWFYGPFLALTSLNRTLWLSAAAQGFLLSYTLFLAESAFDRPRPAYHALLCLFLSLGTAASWVTVTLMPDMFTPIVVLGIVALTFGFLPRIHCIGAVTITAAAIAAHLSHLILAAACIVVAALLRRAIPWRPMASLAAALVFLLLTNWIGHGRIGISPYGSVFALARLIGDGPARDYLAQACRHRDYLLCRWRGQLTSDSDQFLWDRASPFWADPAPLPVFATEAREIVAGTIRTYPRRVALDALRNTVHELGRVTLGDTVVSEYLEEAVRPRLAHFLAEDAARFDRSLQAHGELAAAAQPFISLQLTLLAVGAGSCTMILIAALRRPTRLADLTALILVALLANAFATGALSTPHDRYQLRIAWLTLLPGLLLLPRVRPRRRAVLSANTPQQAQRTGDPL